MQTIRVRTCLLIPEQKGEEIPYTPSVSTVGGLLRHLSEQIDFELVNDKGDVFKDLAVAVNGKDLCFCPSGLATPLQPDDRVGIYFIPIGGG